MAEPTVDIHDDLHGTVHLLPHERKIVDSPWFQRLRGIKQLGLAHMVFPGAEHTRFAHSIGVFHLASRVAERLRAVLNEQDRMELRAAALLHDVGHFPFSHTLEAVYEKREAEEAQAGAPRIEDWVQPESPRVEVAGQQGHCVILILGQEEA